MQWPWTVSASRSTSSVRLGTVNLTEPAQFPLSLLPTATALGVPEPLRSVSDQVPLIAAVSEAVARRLPAAVRSATLTCVPGFAAPTRAALPRRTCTNGDTTKTLSRSPYGLCQVMYVQSPPAALYALL